MATEVDKLILRIESDMSQLRRDLKKIEKQSAQSTQKVSKSFATMGTAIKATVGIVVASQVTRMGMSMVELASAVEEQTAKASVVFGNNFGRISEDLENFGNTVGRSTHELVNMASTVQDTFVPLGFARNEASDLSVQLTKLAVDVASFNNASDTETMRAFQSAIVGNHETVRRFGIVITEATLQQELNRMGIRKSMKEVTNAEKVQARLNLIIAGTSDAHNDATRTADSFANRQKALNSAIEEFNVAIITPLLPKLASFVGFLTQIVNLLTFESGEPSLTLELEDLTEQLETAKRELEDLLEQNFGIKPENIFGLGSAEKKIQDLEKQILDVEKKIQEEERKIDGVVTPKQPINIGDPNRESLRPFRERRFVDTADSSGFLELQKRIKVLNELRLLQSDYFSDLAKGYQEEQEDLINSRSINEDYLSQLALGYEVAQGEAEKLREIQDQLTDVAIKGFDRMENAMLDFMDGTTQGFDGLRDAMRFFLKDIQRTILQMTVFNKIKNNIFGTDLPEATGGQIFDNIFGMFTRASGGRVQRGRPYLVGERGAEMFVPNTGGTIMNNMNTRGIGGGTTVVNQTINVDAGVSQTVRAEIINLLPVIKQDTISSLLEAKRRGGSFATALS